ncbi:MAG: hypothetical protein U5L09_04460 [Bacteroidales bacterium]|nr:hypothetical protein [Bacteroidales bacterium]
MKKKIFALLITALFFSQSCDEVNDILTFTIENETEFTIENQFPVGTPFNVPTPDISSNSSESFENNNTSAQFVEEITLAPTGAHNSSPEDFTFSFLKSIKIYISAEEEERIMIASLDDIPEDAVTIDLETRSQNLKPYIIRDTYNLEYEIVTREAFANDITLRTNMVFKVKANPL